MTPINWPTQSGYYLIENTVPQDERLDGGKGTQTIRRLCDVEVVTEGRSRYERGGDRYPTWQPPGAYVFLFGVEGWRELTAYCGNWQGLRFIPLDLALIASAYDASQA